MPIPWNHIVSYAEYAGLDLDIWSSFTIIIRAMDNEYMKWTGEQSKTSNKK